MVTHSSLEQRHGIGAGHIPPIDGAAIAADAHALLATIVRLQGESFADLMQRLDQEIGRTLQDGVQTNEIEGGRCMLAAPRKNNR